MLHHSLLEMEERVQRVFGSYLSPGKAQQAIMCQICHGAVGQSYVNCFSCHQALQQANNLGLTLSNNRGYIFYSWSGSQTHANLTAYKYGATEQAKIKAQTFVMLALQSTLFRHLRCVEKKTGVPISGWTCIPSLRESTAYNSTGHALFGLITRAFHGTASSVPHILVNGHPTTQTKTFDPDHFEIAARPEMLNHVLIIDDTWTRGNHAQSLAAKLHISGAGIVSSLTMSRYLGSYSSYPHQNTLLDHAKELMGTWKPTICPWTDDGICP